MCDLLEQHSAEELSQDLCARCLHLDVLQQLQEQGNDLLGDKTRTQSLIVCERVSATDKQPPRAHSLFGPRFSGWGVVEPAASNYNRALDSQGVYCVSQANNDPLTAVANIEVLQVGQVRHLSNQLNES